MNRIGSDQGQGSIVVGNPSWDQRASCPVEAWDFSGGAWRKHRLGGCTHADLSFGVVSAHLDSREVRWSAVVGSGLIGGDVTKAAALAQFLLQ